MNRCHETLSNAARPVLFIVVLCLLATAGSGAEDLDAAPSPQWYLSIGMASNHPQLRAAEKQIDSEINGLFGLIAPGFDDVRTFSDQRDTFMIWTPFVSVGRTLSTRWDLFGQVGYTAGKVRTKATDPSLLLLPLHTDVSFERSAFFAGLGVEWFPWEMPELRKYTSLTDRLTHSKPFLGTTLNWNYLTANADVKAALVPFGTLLKIEQPETWRVWNAALYVGLDVPLGSRTTLCANVAYNLFFDYGDDFNGPSGSIYWQWHF